jgi:hypothetical protein
VFPGKRTVPIRRLGYELSGGIAQIGKSGFLSAEEVVWKVFLVEERQHDETRAEELGPFGPIMQKSKWLACGMLSVGRLLGRNRMIDSD